MKKSIKKVLIILVLVLAAFFVLPSVFMNAYLAKLTDIPKETKTVTAADQVDSEEQGNGSERIGMVNVDGMDVSESEAVRSDDEAIRERYLMTLEPADDKFDFMYANDHDNLGLIKMIIVRDSKAYGEITGINKKITVEDIEEVLKSNNQIDNVYKDFIVQYAKDWLALYPESDFRVFYHNLKTLTIDVVSEHEMGLETQSTDSAACYLRKENKILLLEGQDFSKGTDNYIILTHELTHCARSTTFDLEDGYKMRAYYYDYYLLGTYAEEGIITNIAYAMQGMGGYAYFYPFQSSCYRIIMDCTGYDGEDFMNHNVNYLMTMMDEYMGDDQYAWYIIALIDSISSEKYTPYQEVHYTNYQDLCDYITKMYMKKYLPEDADLEMAEQVYAEYCDNIMFRFDEMTKPYPITEENFRMSFEQCLTERGIQ